MEQLQNTPIHGTASTASARAAALTEAVALVMKLRERLEPLLVALSDDERAHMLPVPRQLPTVGAEMLQAAASKPYLPEVVTEFQPGRVAEQMAEAQALATLLNQVLSLARSVGDTRNTRLAEAYRSLLALYTVAKSLADNDASYAPIVRPFAEMYDGRARPKVK